MNQAQQSQQYIFCYNQGLPTTLVILQDSDRIIQLLFANLTFVQITFIMINQNPSQHIQFVKRNIESQIKIQLAFYNNLQLLLAHLQEQRFTQNIVIICAPQIKSHLMNNKCIQCLICFPAQQSSELQECSISLYQIQNQQQLISILKLIKKRNQKQQYKILPNFLHLNDEVSTSNVLAQSLWAMVNHKYDETINNLILNELQKLFKKMEKLYQEFKICSTKFQQFIAQLKQGYLSCQKSMYWYTFQTPIYKIFNNLLRSTQDSYLLFYIQPFFKSLFDQIKRLYKKQKNQRQFICYRGGKINEQELEKFTCSVGGVVQNLGFLSTSLSKQVIERYIQNVLFQIIIDEEYNSGFNFGYAFIAKHSYYSAQSEILFNPLNFFKVLSIKERISETENIFQIQLLFQSIKSKSFQLNWDQKLNMQLMNKQKSLQNYIKYQGDALIYFIRAQKIGLIYWQKYNQIIQTKCKKLLQVKKSITESQYKLEKEQQYKQLIKQYNHGLLKIICYFKRPQQLRKLRKTAQTARQNLKNLQLTYTQHFTYSTYVLAEIYYSLENFEECFLLLSQLQRLNMETNQMKMKIRLLQAKIHLQKREYQVALSLYQQLLQSNQKYQGGKYHLSQILYGIANLYFQKSQYEKSLQFYFQAIQIHTKLSGKKHFLCAYILYYMGIIYKVRGQYKKSLQFSKQALKIYQDCYGAGHLQNANYLAFIGQIYQNLALYQKAIQYYESSLNILKKFGQEKDQLYLRISLRLSRIYFIKRQFDKASTMYQNVKSIILEVFGKNNELYVLILLDLVDRLMQKKQYDSLLQLIQKQQQQAIKYCKQQFKMGYSYVLNTIAFIYNEKQELSKALALYEESLQMSINIQGSAHLQMVNITNIATIYLKLHNFSQSYQISTKAQLIILKRYGLCSSYYAEWLCRTAYIYEEMADLKSALIFQTNALKIKYRISHQNLIQCMNFYKRKGDLYCNMGQFEKALKIYKHIHNILKANKTNLNWIQNFRRMVQLYIQTANKQKAYKLLEENSSIKIPKAIRKKILKKIKANKFNKCKETIVFIHFC